MQTCDGCGAVADDKHIRERIERLEWATRFRPVHIQVLLIAGAPPLRMQDYFYRPAKDGEVRSAGSREFFDQLTKAVRGEAGSEPQEESALANFQRKGLFLTYAVECPVEESGALDSALTGLFPTLLKRIQFSYRPRSVALVSDHLRPLVPLLQQAGWGHRIILDNGVPFPIETAGVRGKGLEAFGERLASAVGETA